ncbi:MAG: PCMD domain-containing protein [Bacteroides sp.]
MNFKTVIVYACSLFLSSACIQEEALNSEAAIDRCDGKDVQLANINADSKEINIYVNKGANLSKQELRFTLAKESSIKVNENKPGDTPMSYDFSEAPHTRQFTVTSEDGLFKPVYTVQIIPTELPLNFHFETLLNTTNTPYDIFYELDRNLGRVLQWSTGNPGYKLTGMAQTREDYPTVQVADGYQGKALKLETRSTGSFGAMAKMYIAAGNLFVGSFDLGNALTNPLKSTKFGYQFYNIPTRLKGYYKYKSGPMYSVNGQVQAGIKDRCDIYAMMYEAEDNTIMLNGENALTSESIVLLAQIKPEDIIEGDQWIAFDLPFEPVNNKTIDQQKLKDGKYKLGIVLSSSADGAHFKGAVGSTLYIDEMELVCEK